MESARAEATAWATPLLIGEYGIGPMQPNADLWMGVQATLHDRYLASDAFWVWKEQSQGAWGVFDFTNGAWTERPQVVAWISRVHAARIAGTVTANEYDATTGALRLETHDGGGVPHSIYLPSTATITCNDATVTATRDAATGLVEVPCDGVLVVTRE